MTTRRILLLALAISICMFTPNSGFASASHSTAGRSLRPWLQPGETQLWHSPWQNQLEFSFLSQTSARSRCEADRAPEALATPDPLMDSGDGTLRITVSFIVGTDGRVHSPFILESAGPSGDLTVLQAVQRWRYRPAMCNGVPTEVEAKIEFLARGER